MPIPIVDDLTQTVDDAVPITMKIAEVIKHREDKSGELIIDVVRGLRRMVDVETHEETRNRYQAAIAMVEGE